MIAPRLIVITDTTRGERMVERIEAVCRRAARGSVMVQLRDRQLGARARLSLGRELRAITRGAGQLLAVNDRLDLAVLLEADAVHLAESSVSVADARAVVGDHFISCARHDPRAAAEGADAVVLSPVMAPRHGAPALGVSALRTARRDKQLLYALGGVDARTARACLDAGADGVAVIGAVLDSDDHEPLLGALGTL